MDEQVERAVEISVHSPTVRRHIEDAKALVARLEREFGA